MLKMNECGCENAHVDGNGLTWWYVCGVTQEPTDPKLCAECMMKQLTRQKGERGL